MKNISGWLHSLSVMAIGGVALMTLGQTVGFAEGDEPFILSMVSGQDVLRISSNEITTVDIAVEEVPMHLMGEIVKICFASEITEKVWSFRKRNVGNPLDYVVNCQVVASVGSVSV